MARINLKKFIAEHYKGGVTARDVIREGVTNSIHAGADAITVDLWFDRQPGLFGDEVRNVLEKLTIPDDGEGFTQDNLNYFDEICTGHKDDIGGKGVGRLAFLKYANRVEVRSQLASELVEFRYTPDFVFALAFETAKDCVEFHRLDLANGLAGDRLQLKQEPLRLLDCDGGSSLLRELLLNIFLGDDPERVGGTQFGSELVPFALASGVNAITKQCSRFVAPLPRFFE